LAQNSRLHSVSPTLKFWMVLALLFLCISSPSPVVGLALALATAFLTTVVGGIKLRDYLGLMALPLSFLLLSGLALLFEYNPQATGVINVAVFNGYLTVSYQAQTTALLVMSRAFGALSCLYLLSLSTPMSEIITVLRRAHCPDVVVELMYLTYHYIFVLLAMYDSMKHAAESRLGYRDLRTFVRTTGNICANLLACSYRQASTNFDAMESRCYDGEIRFLESGRHVTVPQISIASLAVGTIAFLAFRLV
jgi:cobalt/nickel transport system permease protein